MHRYLHDIVSRLPLPRSLSRLSTLWSPGIILSNDGRIKLSRVVPAMLQRKEQDESTPSARFTGLVNRGNFCYQNSILQGLASLPTFGHFMEDNDSDIDAVLTPGSRGGELCQILTCLARGTTSKDALDVPEQLDLLGDSEQQDAQEYLARLLEVIGKETRARARRMRKIDVAHDARLVLGNAEPLAENQIGTVQGRQHLEHRSAEWARKYLTKCARMPLSGSMLQVMHCHDCDDRGSPQVTEFTCLTLNLSSLDDQTIEDLIEDHIKPEVIDAAIECDFCTQLAGLDCEKKIRSTKAKQLTFGALPRNLVLHVNRSTVDMSRGVLRKNTAPVHFEPVLLIPARWTTDFKKERSKVDAAYELRAVVTHHGDHRSGHYLTYGKREKGWYRLNDEYVRDSAEQEVLRQTNVFMLFYEQLSSVPELDIPLGTQLDSDATAVKGLASQNDAVEVLTSSSSSSSEVDTDEAIQLMVRSGDDVSRSSEASADGLVLRTVTNIPVPITQAAPSPESKAKSENTTVAVN